MSGRPGLWLSLAWLACAACSRGQAEPPAVSAPKSTARDHGAAKGTGPDQTVYSYVDSRGRIRMVSSPDQVPPSARDQVVATDTGRDRRQRIAADRVVVLDLRRRENGAPLNYSLVDLARLGQAPTPVGPPEDPGGLGRRLVRDAAVGVRRLLGVEAPGTGFGPVILYSAPWCGFCKKAAAYLRERRVPFVERNIEADRNAALELQRKLSAAGLHGGGIPVLDIGGTLVVGFDRPRIEALLRGGEMGR